MSRAQKIAEDFFGSSKAKRNLCKTAIVISSIDAQVHVALYIPILALIAQSFTGQEALVNFAFSVTSGAMVVFIFISGFLAQFFDKRTLMICGTSIFILGGLLGSLAPSAEILVATRAVEGAGAGLVYAMVPATASQIFKGKERTALLGYTNSGSCAVTFVLNLAAGFMGRMLGWRACLLLYGILLITLFFQIKYIPKTGPERDILRLKKASGEKVFIPKGVFLYTAAFFFLNTFGAAYQIILPAHVIASGIGDSVLIGTASSCNVFVGIVVGITFGRLSGALRKLTPALAIFCISLAYLIWAFSTSALPIYGGFILVGICYGIMIPYLTDCVAKITNEENATFSMTILLAFGSLLGFFFLSFTVGLLVSLTEGNVMYELLILAGVFGTAFIALVIWGAHANTKKTSPETK